MPLIIDSHIVITQNFKIPFSEIKFITSRSSGPGGQNVNKLETRVELIFDIANTKCLSESIRQLLLMNLSAILKPKGILRIVVQETRSQWRNKRIALDKLEILLKSALKNPQKRIETKPTILSIEKRLRNKQERSEIKKMRQNVNPDS